MSRLTRSRTSNLQIHDASTSEDEDDNPLPSTSSGSRGFLSQDSGIRQMNKKSTSQSTRFDGRNALSQGNPRLNSTKSNLENVNSKSISLQEEIDLVGKVIRFLFIVENKKQVIQKMHIVKNVLGGSTKNFQQIMEKVKTYLSKVFGYKLVDTGGGKFILVNEIKNELPHLKFNQSIRSQQVLLFIVLAQIFMQQDACREETLWDLLRRLHIIEDDNFHHEYFGDVKKLITVDFIAQHYLKRIVVDKANSPKYEYKWGIRAEHEVSYRDVLEFMSKVYGGCPINTWAQQYKAMLQQEKSQS